MTVNREFTANSKDKYYLPADSIWLRATMAGRGVTGLGVESPPIVVKQ